MMAVGNARSWALLLALALAVACGPAGGTRSIKLAYGLDTYPIRVQWQTLY